MFDFQFPYFLTDEINRRIIEDAKGYVKNEREIINKIREFVGSKQRMDMIIGENYYIGRHDILKRKRTAIGEGGKIEIVDNLPNNRIIDNQYKKMIDQKVNYIVGKPITFNSNNKNYVKLVKDIINTEFSHSLKNVARDALNCGIGWVFVSYDEKGDIVFKRIKPWELVPVWKDEEHTRLDYGIRFFDIKVNKGHRYEVVRKVEIYDKFGICRYVIDNGRLIADGKDWCSPYFYVNNDAGGWGDIPLIEFKYNENEVPLIKNVKTLQDGLNLLLSNFQNAMEEDVRNTILVLKNYDGENLGEFRRNLATYGAVKVRSADGSQGGVDTLNIQVSSENYKAIIELFKKAIIENAMGYDAKDDRLMGQPNQMNILSMYSDINLDTNSIEMEFQRSLKKILFFVDMYLMSKGLGDFSKFDKEVIFNRDIMINESDLIENCIKSLNLLSRESVVARHPWVENVEKEISKIKKEKNEKVTGNDFSDGSKDEKDAEKKSEQKKNGDKV